MDFYHLVNVDQRKALNKPSKMPASCIAHFAIDLDLDHGAADGCRVRFLRASISNGSVQSYDLVGIISRIP